MNKLLSFIACVLIMLSSCSNIDENDRFIYVPPVAVGRCVLIEDFTGQTCLNCPRAAETIEKLQEQYGADTVIAVAIHSGPLALKPTASVIGLRTDLGDLYYGYWKVESQPSGLVNRKGGLTNDSQWASLVYNEIQQKATVDIKLAISNDTITHQSHVKATINNLGESFCGKLQLWLVEDDIKALQRMPDGKFNKEYIHNHVLRKAINGDWGEEIALGKDATADKEADFQLENGWKVKNMSIVAFVYNDNGVLQVTRKKLVNP